MKEPWKGSPLFWATCPRCGSRQKWTDSRTCFDCGARLYPTKAEITRARRENECRTVTAG